MIPGFLKQVKFPPGIGSGIFVTCSLAVSFGFVAAICGFIVFAVQNPQPRPFHLAIGLAGVASAVWHYRAAGRRLPSDPPRSPILDSPQGDAPETIAGNTERLGWAAMIPICRGWALVCLWVGGGFYAFYWGGAYLVVRYLAAVGARITWNHGDQATIFSGVLVALAPIWAGVMGWANIYGVRVLAGLPLKAGTIACLLVSQALALTAIIALPAILFDLAVNWTHPALSPIVLLPVSGLGAIGVGVQVRGGFQSFGIWLGSFWALGTVPAALLVIFFAGDLARFPEFWTILASAAAILLGWVWVYWELTSGRRAYRARPPAAIRALVS